VKIPQWSISGWAFPPPLCCFAPYHLLCFFAPLSLKIFSKGDPPTFRTTELNLTEDIFRLLRTNFDSHKTDLFLIVKLKKFKSMEKIWIAKTCEINIAIELPYCNEKWISPQTLPFPIFFSKHLPYFLSSVWQPCFQELAEAKVLDHQSKPQAQGAAWYACELEESGNW